MLCGLLIPLILPVAVFGVPPVKICVSPQEEEPCRQMEQDIPDKFSCVIARDWVDCARKLQQGKADLVNLDIRSIYMAGRYFDAVPIAAEVIEGTSILYNGVALIAKGSNIKSLADLRGKRACHTALGRTAWQLSMARLMSKGILQPQTCAASQQGSIEFIKMVNDFFSGGNCAPGDWTPDPLVTKELKNRFPGLCSRCHDPESCLETDEYAAYQGTIRCLVQGSGDVSFTSIEAVKEYLSTDSSLVDKAELLCLDGRVLELTSDGTGLESCYWGFRPSSGFVTSAENQRINGEKLMAVIEETQALYTPTRVRKPDWYYKTFFSRDDVERYEPVSPDRQNYRTYLGEDYMYAIEGLPCQSSDQKNATWCAISESEKAKCEDYAKAAYSRSLWPKIDCVLASSKVDCMELLKIGNAKVVVLDGGDAYKGGRYYDLQPVSAELYGTSDGTYFAVAALRSASDVTKLSELRGLRSCHTGIGRTAGWVVPVGSLVRDGSLASDQCDLSAEVADFFTSGSCVPGANDTKSNPGRSHADKLCQQCVGDEEGRFKCSRDSKERYSGYAGAFRCLAEGKGDVAFVKHTTVPSYTDGNSNDDWARDLLSSDFQLLCGQGGNAPITEYANCKLAKVPSHLVMTNKDATADDRLSLAKLMADSSKYFYDTYSRLFRIFGSSGSGQKDLLFKDSTTSLKAIPFTYSYVDALGQAFYDASAAVDPKTCQNDLAS